MTRRLPAAVMAALFICGAIAAPAPARAVTAAAPVAPEPFDSLTVRFAYDTTVGTALSDDGQTRTITLRSGQDAETALAAWENSAGVLAVVPNIPVSTLADPVDPLWAAQWDLKSATPTATNGGAANVASAWSSVTGDGVIVAVIDTGRTNHPDLLAAMPDGWGVDMVSSTITSHDGDGRDMDPTDMGDACGWRSSSWHATHVAGTIAAQPNDIGVVGIAPNVKIEHVRVLGTCGGGFDDVVDGIRWAAGLTTNWYGAPWSAFGLTNNAHPADVINMSFGGNGGCFDALQEAITAARSAGIVVVAAAGNGNQDAALFTPANCNDTVTVASIGRVGARAYYSNFGTTIDIAAPGGDMMRDSGILSTLGSGATDLIGYSYGNYQGTSMAAPHVVGVVALILSAHPTWGPAEIEQAIYAGARPFPADSGSPCVITGETPTGLQQRCGVGILDAVGALSLLTPNLTITAPTRMDVGTTTIVSATSDQPGDVSLLVAAASAANCSLLGNVLAATSTGTCTLNSATPATADHVAVSATMDVLITGTPQTINFGADPLLTATDIPFGTTPPALIATASSGLRVGYESRTPSICEAAVHDGISEEWHLRLLNVGICTVLATQPGNAVYEPATSIERSFTIVQGSQTIGLDDLTDHTFDPTIVQALPRFSSANLPLNYSGLSSNVCEPQFNGFNFELRVFRPGTCTIRAEQIGNSTYLPAESVARTFEVFKLAQTPLIFQAGPNYQIVNSTGSYGNGGGSTMAPFVAISLTPRICTVSKRTIRYLKVGTCILQGSKDGDEWHQAVSKKIRITVFAPARLTATPRINQIGKIVYATRGTWVGGPTPSFKYQWFSCSNAPRTSCTPIKGATSTKLTVTSKIAGKYAFLRVFMYQAGYERARTDSNVIKISAK